MASPQKPQPSFDDIKNMTFEAALAELEGIVKRLEGGQGNLESSIDDYMRGNALKEHCNKKLEAAKLKISAVTQAADGTVSAAPFESKE